MRNPVTFVLAIVLTVLATGASVDAASSRYEIDNTHSSIIFKVQNREISYVYGFFKKISGVINTDRLRDPEQLMIDVEVEVKSLDTRDKKRDRHVTSPEFLDRAKHPTISFTTKRCTMLESNKFELAGTLTLLGVKKDITVEFEMIGCKEIEKNKFRLGGQTTFTIKRSDFGMDYMVPEIADEVTIIVNLEGEQVVVPAG